MTQAKQDIQDTQCTSKNKRLNNSKLNARLKTSLTPRAFRRRCAIGLAPSKSISYEELHRFLSLFAAEQWEQLPTHATDWERGQIDGLFWAMDKLDELIEKE
jgi:hypothetical protein